jgi:hypothetical protein
VIYHGVATVTSKGNLWLIRCVKLTCFKNKNKANFIILKGKYHVDGN